MCVCLTVHICFVCTFMCVIVFSSLVHQWWGKSPGWHPHQNIYALWNNLVCMQITSPSELYTSFTYNSVSVTTSGAQIWVLFEAWIFWLWFVVFSWARHEEFSLSTPVPSPPSWVTGVNDFTAENMWFQLCQHDNLINPRRWNVATSIVGFENGHLRKNLTQNSEPQRYSWEHRRRR